MTVMFIGMAVSSVAVGVHTSKSAGNSAVALIIYCLLNTVILAVFIMNSRLRGIKLMGTVFIIFWGIQYLMTQIETLYFNAAVKMPVKEVITVVVSGALSALIFSFFAVLILSRFKKDKGFMDKGSLGKLPLDKLFKDAVVLSLSYVFIYFIFGYFVAWQFADVRYYYTGSTEIMNFFQHMANQLKSDSLLPVFQIFRGLLWTGLSILIFAALERKGWKTYIITGMLFSVLISSTLVFPNDYMPAAVRFAHSIELFSSMFLFGVLSRAVFISSYNINNLNQRKLIHNNTAELGHPTMNVQETATLTAEK